MDISGYSRIAKIIIYFFIGLFIILLGWIQFSFLDLVFVEKLEFIETEDEINGVITRIETYKGASELILYDSIRCNLYGAGNDNYKPSSLSDFLKIGDSIYKPRNTDSLYIIRNGQEYYFILQDRIFKDPK